MQSLLSAVTLGELLKPTENREAYYETSLSQVWRKQYLFKKCMLVLNKLVLNRFLTGLLLQTLALASPSCNYNVPVLLQNRGVSDQVR